MLENTMVGVLEFYIQLLLVIELSEFVVRI